MASELLEKQWRFAESVPRLLDHARELGYRVTLGEVYRSDEQSEINAIGFDGRKQVAQLIAKQFPLLARKLTNNGGNGVRNSVHMLRLAIDLQLFDAAGKWVQETYPYMLCGEYWEALGTDHRWGGRFGDTPHFSIEHEGVR